MQAPTYEILTADEAEQVGALLHETGQIADGESVLDVRRAGEGNMNLVLRVRTNLRTMILKQSRPWVEKYPSIAAPVERIASESAFYRAVSSTAAIANRMPAVLAEDPSNHLMLLQDLGDVQDCTSMYGSRTADPADLRTLCSWLSALHSLGPFDVDIRSVLANRDMRKLNHEHIFDLPLRPDNGLSLDDITPGLQDVADGLKSNDAYVSSIRELGVLYLSDGNTLLHGDYYPGSWVRTTAGPCVIDPEFGFFGAAEFDAGVMAAHLIMVGLSDGAMRDAFQSYVFSPQFDRSLMSRFAGTEMMRRLIGVAQLPMSRTLEEKRVLLCLSEELVLQPEKYRFI